MERMKKEKESGTLLGVGTAYLPVKEIKGEFYVKVSDFTRCINELEQEKENLSELNRKQSKAFKETMKDYRELLRDYMKIGEENKKLKEEIKEIEKNQEYRYHRCMKAERQVQHSLGGDDELIYEE